MGGTGVGVAVGVGVLVGVGVGVAVGIGVGVLVGVGEGVAVGVGVEVGVAVGVGVGVGADSDLMATVWYPPVEMADQLVDPVDSWVGVCFSATVPSPSWPKSFLPQAQRVPSDFRATVRPKPAEMADQLVDPVDSWVGACFSATVPSPSWP